MQAKEELLSTQKALDEKTVMDDTGKIDKTARAESMRVQGGQDLQRLLGLPSLTDLDGFKLPDGLVTIINNQRACVATPHDAPMIQLYSALRKINPSIPDPAKTPAVARQRGSQLHVDLKKALQSFGLIDDWPGKPATKKCEAFIYAGRDDDGNQIKTLRAGYGFKPNNELV